MPTVADRVRFCETHVTNKEGARFSLAGRDWVRDELFRAADGWKLWRGKDTEPCADCLELIGDIIEHPSDNATTTIEHRLTGCPGLVAEPIIVTILNLQRQDGKTFSSLGLALSDLFLGRGKSIGLLTASEDQAERLFAENYAEAISRSPALAKRCEVTRMGIHVPKTHGRFEAMSTAHRSVTGRSRTRLLIDEARDIEARVVMALLPAVFAMHGVECPRGHVQLDAEHAVGAPEKCSACGERLVPWFGRITITSSSGVYDNSERDWLAELIESLQAEPHPNYHVFASEATLNPAKSQKIIGAIDEVFSRLETTRDYVAAEIGNKWTVKGDPVATKQELDQVLDKKLVNADQCDDPCVAYLDTSDTVELTSLVILAWDQTRGEKPWEYVYTPLIKIWVPSQQPGKRVNEEVVMPYLATHLKMFPHLATLEIDTRGRDWPRILMAMARKDGYSWARALRAPDKNYDSSIIGWNQLLSRIKAQTIRVQDLQEIRREFAGLKRRDRDRGPSQIIDKNRKKSHKDVTESLAMCCHLASREELKASSSSIARRRAAEPKDVAQMARDTRAKMFKKWDENAW